MSDLRATIPPVRAELETLVTLASNGTTLGQIDYIDALATQTVLWATRPGDIERVGGVLHELIQEVATTRAKASA